MLVSVPTPYALRRHLEYLYFVGNNDSPKTDFLKSRHPILDLMKFDGSQIRSLMGHRYGFTTWDLLNSVGRSINLAAKVLQMERTKSVDGPDNHNALSLVDREDKVTCAVSLVQCIGNDGACLITINSFRS